MDTDLHSFRNFIDEIFELEKVWKLFNYKIVHNCMCFSKFRKILNSNAYKRNIDNMQFIILHHFKENFIGNVILNFQVLLLK